MAKYKSFLHVERLGKDEVDGILNGTCYISPKLDGTNAVVWCDDGEICAGSRNRKLSAVSDNANFYTWVHSEDEEAAALREMLMDNQHLIVYGEFGVGRVAHIKDYDECAHDKLWIFDMYDTTKEHYVHPETVKSMCERLGLGEWVIPFIKVDNPTEEDIVKWANDNKFLLSQANHAGEGMVIRNPDFCNKWGHYCIAKFVLDEFKQRMVSKGEKTSSKRTDCEQAIIDYYVTEAELSKAKAKVCLTLGLEEFDKKNGKSIGMYLNLVFNDAVLAEIADICKRYKRPVIDFQVLNNLCSVKAREYIGL